MTISAESETLLQEMKTILRLERKGYRQSAKTKKRMRQLKKIDEYFRTGDGQDTDSDELFRVLHRNISIELNPEMVCAVFKELKDHGIEHPEDLMDSVGMDKRNRVVASYASALKSHGLYGIHVPEGQYRHDGMGEVCALAMQSCEDDVDLITSAIEVRHLFSAEEITAHLVESRQTGAPLASGVL
jgi:hypothetical protein